MLSRFHLIPERHGQTDRQTDGRTDGLTDRIAISISRVSVLTRNKNTQKRYISLICLEAVDECVPNLVMGRNELCRIL